MMKKKREETVDPILLEQLKQLYPGEDPRKKYQEYQRRKRSLQAAVLLLTIAGFVILLIGENRKKLLEDGAYLRRKEFGNGSYLAKVTAETEGNKESLVWEVEERKLSGRELAVQREAFKESLLRIMLAGNEDKGSITGDLNLPRKVEGYPFAITWNSDQLHRISLTGKVNREDLEGAKETVLLTATIRYGEDIWQENFELTVLPESYSEKEYFQKSLNEEMNRADSGSAEQEKIPLPLYVNGKKLSWKEKPANGKLALFPAGLFLVLLISGLMEKDLRERNREREKQIVKSYPSFVSKLRLYIGAGLSCRNAFIAIAREYESTKGASKEKKYLYEETLLSAYRLLNGEAEEKVYRDWGVRCKEAGCRKLSFLLIANNRQGNNKLLQALEEEALSTFEEEKLNTRRRGEEAGIKLLFPMMLMLVVVMLLIMVPVFSGFGNL